MNADLNILSGRAKGIYLDGIISYDGAVMTFSNKNIKIKMIKIEFISIVDTKIVGNGMLQETKRIGLETGRNYSFSEFIIETKLAEVRT